MYAPGDGIQSAVSPPPAKYGDAAHTFERGRSECLIQILTDGLSVSFHGFESWQSEYIESCVGQPSRLGNVHGITPAGIRMRAFCTYL